jgi:hypothetical protein
MEMRGVYKEIMPPDRLVSTESWGGDWPETINTLLLAEQGGQTLITNSIRYPSKEARDAALKTGMQDGMATSFERLAEYLASVAEGGKRVPTLAEQLALKFEAINAEAISIVEECTGEQWRRPAASEGWPVGVVAHHIAEVHQDFVGLLEALASGQARSPGDSMEGVDQSNARHAHDYAAVGKPETLDALRANGAAVARLLRGFGDAQLGRAAGVFGGRELSVAQVAEWIVIGHAAEHLASLRATLAS